MEILENTLDVPLETFLDRRLFAHLAMVSPEGYPRHAPLWFIWEDEQLWFIVDTEQRTIPDRIEYEPKTAVAVVDFDPQTGTLVHVGMRGESTIEPFDADRAERLLLRYFRAPKETWNPDRFGDPQEWDESRYVFVRFDPETVVIRDQSYEIPGESGG